MKKHLNLLEIIIFDNFKSFVDGDPLKDLVCSQIHLSGLIFGNFL